MVLKGSGAMNVGTAIGVYMGVLIRSTSARVNISGAGVQSKEPTSRY